MKLHWLAAVATAALVAAGGCAAPGEAGHAPRWDTPSTSFTGPEAQITRRGEPVELAGKALHVGDAAPDAELVTCDLGDLKISDLRGRIVVLSIAPSLDTPVCNNQTMRFDKLAPAFGDEAVVVSATKDLPSALRRWRADRAVDQVTLVSDYHYRQLGNAYGLLMPENSLLARAAIVIDRDGVIRHIEVVGDLTREPDYQAVARTVAQLRKH
jgi:thiol peroxidase